MSGHYERLSFLDSSFLALESRTTHFHVAGMLVFEAGDLKRPDGGIDVERIKRFIESRLHLIPRYRQRLAHVPLERYPVWVDDAHFNIDYHIRHTSLPKPGSSEQLRALMGRLCSQQLDRSKPLWELNIVEGLEGDHFALISKIHHAMIDGISGVDLMAVLLNLTPTEEFDDPEPFEPRPVPSDAEMIIKEAARRAGRVTAALRSVQTLTDDVQTMALQGARRVRAIRNSLGSGWLSQASMTPLNGTIGPNRRFETLRTNLEEVKEVKNALGGSVNDVILATVAGGVRRYLEAHKVELNDIDFRVMAPVSVRSPSQRGTLGNQVAMWIVSMPVDEPDATARLEAVQSETMKLKMTDQALGAASLVQMSSGAPSTLVSMASRLATGARPFNMTVTNVPGPQFPMHLLGAKLIRQYPLVPLWHGHGVGIALFSYDGEICWGFNADYDVMEDLDGFVSAIEESFQELLAIARGEKPKSVPKPVKKKTPVKAAATKAAGSKSPKKRPPMGGTTKKPASKSNSTGNSKAKAKTATAKKASPAKKPTQAKAAAKTAAKATAAKRSSTAKGGTTKKPTTSAKTRSKSN
ncbi:MAG: wax ester/triacylglycerol synthase family O-acyltransferase [Acidimicrobiia bacterium]|nr:wax ester/triacylglycerol synthase family O-acyltransferase [Acidimicrobiia bacterium]